MGVAIERLQAAQRRAQAIRSPGSGFPSFAEALRRAGVWRVEWHLPGAQALYLTEHGPIVQQGTPLIVGMAAVPSFEPDAVIAAIRADRADVSTFPTFLAALWRAGVVRYVVDFSERTVTYYGPDGANYLETYPAMAP